MDFHVRVHTCIAHVHIQYTEILCKVCGCILFDSQCHIHVTIHVVLCTCTVHVVYIEPIAVVFWENQGPSVRGQLKSNLWGGKRIWIERLASVREL